MSNPWTKKNPLMSMWLSAAHKAAGPVRGQATAARKRQLAKTQADAAKQILDFWTKPFGTAPPKKRTRR